MKKRLRETYIPDIPVNEPKKAKNSITKVLDDACVALETYSPTFKNFFEKFNRRYTDMFSYFVNIDAYKDNHLAFRNGSNQFFTLQHSDLQLYGVYSLEQNLVNFKKMMRDTMQDLEKIKMCYLLHIHKLKYKTNGQIPSPDIVKYLPPVKVYACFDSGSGPSAIFGDKNLHAQPIREHHILCSVANTIIDPGPSGANCDVHIETTYKPTMGSTFFSNFGYANIYSFNSSGKTSFSLSLIDTNNNNKDIKPITQKDDKYLSGNNENNKFFSKSTDKDKLDCDIRTTLKKLGDDLQVFISCLYKDHGGIGTNLVMMLTCDLGVSFMSLMLGVDCVFKDKDDEQKTDGQRKIGCSWYIKSLLGASNIDWDREIKIARNYVLSEYDDFIGVIDDIIKKIKDGSRITIQIKGYNDSYGIKDLKSPNTLLFFNQMNIDLNYIRDFLSERDIEKNSSAIDKLKKCVPNKFLLRHNNDTDAYFFTLAQKYTRGDMIEADRNSGNTFKLNNTPFVAYFKTTIPISNGKITRGGAHHYPLNQYFIDSPIDVHHAYSNTDDLKKPNNERHVYDTSVEPPLYKYTTTDEQVNLYKVIDIHFEDAYQQYTLINKIVTMNIYTVKDLLYNCYSYVDDSLNGYADYDQIQKYVEEYMDMLDLWVKDLWVKEMMKTPNVSPYGNNMIRNISPIVKQPITIFEKPRDRRSRPSRSRSRPSRRRSRQSRSRNRSSRNNSHIERRPRSRDKPIKV